MASSGSGTALEADKTVDESGAGEVAETGPTSVDSAEEIDESAPSAWPPLGRSSSWDSSWRSSAQPTVDEAPTEAAASTDEAVQAVAAAEETQATGTEIGTESIVEGGVAEAEAEEVAVADEVERVTAPADLALDAEPAEEPAIEETAEAEAPAVESPEQQPGPSDLPATAAVAGGIDRAYALIDELRGVVAGLAGGAGESVDAASLADQLAAARTSGADGNTFADLRTAIDSARERPRDIDTMLDVSGRLDVIASLHDAYEHLGSAVDRAVEQLRGAAENESANE
jgi:hypothetical protein